MTRYKFKVTHDHGSMTVTIPSFSEGAARKAIQKMELCPNKAMELVKIMPQGDEKSSYYTQQLEQIDFNNQYPAHIKFSDVHNKSTKWMDVNYVSAQIIIDYLKDKFEL